MSGSPAPRPALKKAADAHIHPAAPDHRPSLLRHAGTPGAGADPDTDAGRTPAAPAPSKGRAKAERSGPAAKVSALAGPLAGNTSDSMRSGGRRAGDRPAKPSGKKVTLQVKIPKSLRKEFSAALKADRKEADAVISSLLRSWLDG